MRGRADIGRIVEDTRNRVAGLFPGETVDAVLFGSYARGDAREDSDLDILFLVNAPREKLAGMDWQLGKIASDLFMDYQMIVSPLVENRSFYSDRAAVLPFYQNIQREGIVFHE